jgi:hypothetical protein
MLFLKRLFSRKERSTGEPLRGGETQQTQAEQDATRRDMEADVTADRERRGATDQRAGERPAEDPTPE